MDRDRGEGHRVEWGLLDPALLHPGLGTDSHRASDRVSVPQPGRDDASLAEVIRMGAGCDDPLILAERVRAATGATVIIDSDCLIVTPRSPADAKRTRRIVQSLISN